MEFKNKGLKPVSVSVERAELRNGKIIVVLKPDLLSGQEFAVNPYYNEGFEKNKLQLTRFSVSIMEQDGEIKECNASYNGYHSTTGNRQIHDIEKMFVKRFDKCLYEILTSDIKYIKEDDRLQKIYSHHEWDSDQLSVLKSSVAQRLREDRQQRLEQATSDLIEAQKRLQLVVSENSAI